MSYLIGGEAVDVDDALLVILHDVKVQKTGDSNSIAQQREQEACTGCSSSTMRPSLLQKTSRECAQHTAR
jgi:hypothetical protein